MENELHKDMTVYELALLMMKVFGGLKNEVGEFKSEMSDFRQETRENFRELDGKVDSIDHRTIMMKQVIEKDLHTQVRW